MARYIDADNYYQRGFKQALKDYESLRENHSHEETMKMLHLNYAWGLKGFWVHQYTDYVVIVTRWDKGYLGGIESKEDNNGTNTI